MAANLPQLNTIYTVSEHSRRLDTEAGPSSPIRRNIPSQLPFSTIRSHPHPQSLSSPTRHSPYQKAPGLYPNIGGNSTYSSNVYEPPVHSEYANSTQFQMPQPSFPMIFLRPPAATPLEYAPLAGASEFEPSAPPLLPDNIPTYPAANGFAMANNGEMAQYYSQNTSGQTAYEHPEQVSFVAPVVMSASQAPHGFRFGCASQELTTSQPMIAYFPAGIPKEMLPYMATGYPISNPGKIDNSSITYNQSQQTSAQLSSQLSQSSFKGKSTCYQYDNEHERINSTTQVSTKVPELSNGVPEAGLPQVPSTAHSNAVSNTSQLTSLDELIKSISNKEKQTNAGFQPIVKEEPTNSSSGQDYSRPRPRPPPQTPLPVPSHDVPESISPSGKTVSEISALLGGRTNRHEFNTSNTQHSYINNQSQLSPQAQAMQTTQVKQTSSYRYPTAEEEKEKMRMYYEQNQLGSKDTFTTQPREEFSPQQMNNNNGKDKEKETDTTYTVSRYDMEAEQARIKKENDYAIKRRYSILEFVKTEKRYADSLQLIVEKFVIPLRVMTDQKTYDLIFCNLGKITEINIRMSMDLKERLGPLFSLVDPTVARTNSNRSNCRRKRMPPTTNMFNTSVRVGSTSPLPYNTRRMPLRPTGRQTRSMVLHETMVSSINGLNLSHTRSHQDDTVSIMTNSDSYSIATTNSSNSSRSAVQGLSSMLLRPSALVLPSSPTSINRSVSVDPPSNHNNNDEDDANKWSDEKITERFRSICIGDIVAKYLENINEHYGKYSANYNKAISFLRDLRENSSRFSFKKMSRNNKKELLKLIEDAEKNKGLKRLDLESFLLTPVQRIMRYPLLLERLLKYTPTDHPDHEDVATALGISFSVASHVDLVSPDLLANVER